MPGCPFDFAGETRAALYGSLSASTRPRGGRARSDHPTGGRGRFGAYRPSDCARSVSLVEASANSDAKVNDRAEPSYSAVPMPINDCDDSCYIPTAAGVCLCLRADDRVRRQPHAAEQLNVRTLAVGRTCADAARVVGRPTQRRPRREPAVSSGQLVEQLRAESGVLERYARRLRGHSAWLAMTTAAKSSR